MSAFADSPWPLVKLGEICGSKERADPSTDPSSEFYYVDIGSVCNQTFKVISPKRLSGRDAPSRARKRIRFGDVLVATTRPYLKSIAQVPQKLNGEVCSTGFCVLRPKDCVTSDWLFYAVLADDFVEQLSTRMRGATYPAVTDRDVLDTAIPLPDLDTQRFVVARIRNCVSRASELSELASQALQDASRLPQSFRYSLWEECAEQYRAIELGSVIRSAKNGLYKPRKHHGSGALLLRMFNINGADFDLTRGERLSVTEKEASDYSIQNGDVIVSRVNSRELVGKSTVVVGLSGVAVFEAMLIRLRIDVAKARQDVLTWLMNSPQFLHDLRMRAKHAIGQSSINQSDLLSCLLPLPPRDRQNALVEKYAGFASLAAGLRAECNSRMEATSGLRESILRKAFAGGL